MAYKSPLSNLVSKQKENGLVKFSGDYGKREYGAPIVAPQTDLGRSMQDFTSLSSVSSSDSSDTPINPAKAARQKGRQERKAIRQENRAKRIEKRQTEKTVRAMQRQDNKNLKQGISQDFQKNLSTSGVAQAPKVNIVAGEMAKSISTPSSAVNKSKTVHKTITEPKDTFNYKMPKKPFMGETAMDRIQGTIAGERYFYSPEETSSDSPNKFVGTIGRAVTGASGGGGGGQIDFSALAGRGGILGKFAQAAQARKAARNVPSVVATAGASNMSGRIEGIESRLAALEGGDTTAGAAQTAAVAPVETQAQAAASQAMAADQTGNAVSGIDGIGIPIPANMKGNAKPLFNPQAQASAEAIYGTPLQRQMSVNSGFMMQSPLEGNAFTKAMADTGGDYEATQEILKNK